MELDWTGLRNPVLGYDGWSIKDACLAWRDGVFHVYFSAFDQERSTVASVTTRDFRTFSDFRFHLDGRADGWIGMCSPDIAWGDGRYVLVFNSWGGLQGRANKLFRMESDDLESWSPPRPLAHELDPDKRLIDGALAWTGDRWMLSVKRIGKPRLAWATSLDGPWTSLGDGPPRLLTTEGTENGMTHENFQFLRIGGVWHLLSTDYKPHHAWLYRMEGDPGRDESWMTWVDGRQLAIPVEAWNTVDVDNAAALLDLTAEDGFFYLIYGGKNETRVDEFTGSAAHERPWPRGWNRLGLARSRDLMTWSVPGA